MQKIYLYLARRDKKEVKILSIFNGESLPATRVPEIKDLGLPAALETKIKATIYQNRLMWETWIESAENSAQLKSNLIERGYKDVPFAGRALFSITPHEESGPVQPNYNKLKIRYKTMLQKKKPH